MRNREFHRLLKKNKTPKNSGFTLTELLVGLIMSIFVIGALGFGLMQILRFTQEGNSESLARNESSRALDFISDEMRGAQAIDVDAATNISTLAPSYTAPAGGTVRLSLNVPGVDERIVYSIAPPINGSPWQGPLVVYRWGPTLDADGSYTNGNNPGAWTNEALVDGISDVAQNATCDGATANYQGFFACVVDDDGDTNTAENLTDTNGDGEITSADGADTNGDGIVNADDGADADGQSITAQLYLTGETETAGNVNTDTYTADTRTVARARVAPGSTDQSLTAFTVSFRSLGAVYGCNPLGNTTWSMRTDFINDPTDPDNTANNSNAKWVHQEFRQPQPINIDSDRPLTINSIPVAPTGNQCISRGGVNAVGNENFFGNESLLDDGSDNVYNNDPTTGDYTDLDPNGNPTLNDIYHVVSHTIDFDNPETYNGYTNNNDDIFVGNGSDSTVLFLRPGDLVPADAGYDADADASTAANNQDSLRAFLNDQGVLRSDFTVDPAKLSTNERIVIFEVGQTDTNHPGFDRQDNAFILTSDVFAKDAP